MTLSIRQDRRLIRAEARSTRYVLARINAPRAEPGRPRIPINVSLVLDRSGSMEDERKFALAARAVEQALHMLRDDDRFSLVVYDTEVGVLCQSTLATADAKRRALRKLGEIGPRGGTDLGGGWLSGCEQLAEFHLGEGVSRCLLLTDGLANHGMTDPGELCGHAVQLRRRGITTSTFGVGNDFDERLLRDMAHDGGGNFYFIEGAAQIPAMLTSELGEALEVTLRNAAIVVTPPPGARVETLNRFPQRWLADREELRVEVGDLVSGQELDVVLKVRFERGEPGAEAELAAALTTGTALVAGSECRLSWTYAGHAENDAQPRDVAVDRAVAAVYAARARAEAADANREGRYDRAQRLLQGTAFRIREYAGEDGELLGMVASLREDVGAYAAPMSAAAMKGAVFGSAMALRSRGSEGKARRGQ